VSRMNPAPQAETADAGEPGAPEPHLPHGSGWPIVLGFAIALVGLGFVVLDMESIRERGEPFLTSGWLLVLGLAAVVGAVLGWVRQDHQWWWDNVGTGKGMAKAGTLLFISSEVFIFGSLFATYFTYQRIQGAWPDNSHVAEHLLETSALVKVLVFSAFLFLSSATIHKADKAIKNGDRKTFKTWWGLTILLGLVFLAGQVWEYANLISSGLKLHGSGYYMTNFYMLTGTHGLHVFGGLCLLTIVWVRGMKGQFDGDRHAAPLAAAMYWHFVDLVWVFVLTTLYLVPAFLGGGHA